MLESTILISNVRPQQIGRAPHFVKYLEKRLAK